MALSCIIRATLKSPTVRRRPASGGPTRRRGSRTSIPKISRASPHVSVLRSKYGAVEDRAETAQMGAAIEAARPTRGSVLRTGVQSGLVPPAAGPQVPRRDSEPEDAPAATGDPFGQLAAVVPATRRRRLTDRRPAGRPVGRACLGRGGPNRNRLSRREARCSARCGCR